MGLECTAPNFMTDRRLSFKARGILAYLVEAEIIGNFQVEDLIQASEEDGPTAVRSALQELIKYHYVKLILGRDNQGRLCGKRYISLIHGFDDSLNVMRKGNAIVGYVYVIKGESYYKIGCTKNISRRLVPMQAHAPFPLETLVLIASGDMVTLEAELHETFAAKRIRGEWFNLDEEDITYIRNTYDISDPSILKVQ